MREELAVFLTASVLGLVVGGLFALLTTGRTSPPVMYQAGCYMVIDLGHARRIDSYNFTLLAGQPGPAPKRPVYSVGGGGMVAERPVIPLPLYVAEGGDEVYVAVASLRIGGETYRVLMPVASEPCFVIATHFSGSL